MKRAIAHKDYDCRGGGERLVETMADAFDWPLYVGSFDVNNADTTRGIDVDELFGEWWQQALIGRGGLTRSLAYRYLWQQDAQELHEYDTVILSGNEPLWYIGPDEQTTVAYTHSTPRYMYDLFPQIENSVAGRIWQAILEQQRTWYQGHTKKPDLWIANSDLVARRIQKYWGIAMDRIEVVYPPVQTDQFSPDDAPTRDYYVCVSRLVDAKNIDWLITQANRLDLPLKIAGTGPAEDDLREQAGESVEMLGYVSEDRKAELLSGARAFIMTAENEDFGMTPIEALAAGTPVLAVNDGFTKYQITDGREGILFERTPQAFANAVETFEAEGVTSTAGERAYHAERFSVEKFRDGIISAVEKAEERAAIEPAYKTDPQHDPQEVLADGGDD